MLVSRHLPRLFYLPFIIALEWQPRLFLFKYLGGSHPKMP